MMKIYNGDLWIRGAISCRLIILFPKIGVWFAALFDFICDLPSYRENYIWKKWAEVGIIID